MIQSVRKAMKILSTLADRGGEPMSLSEIEVACGYPKSTVAHLLEALCHDGYATHIRESHRYALGPATYYLTRHGRYEEEFVTICRPVMRWMERTSHGTVVLSVIRSRQKFIIDYADHEQGLFVENTKMRIGDIYRTATGRILLSYMDREDVAEIYEEYGNPKAGHWDEVTSLQTLCSALDAIRTQEVIVTKPTKGEGNRLTNAFGYASPIFKDGRCIGALGIAYKPTTEDGTLTPEDERCILRVLKNGRKEIERRLAYGEKTTKE